MEAWLKLLSPSLPLAPISHRATSGFGKILTHRTPLQLTQSVPLPSCRIRPMKEPTGGRFVNSGHRFYTKPWDVTKARICV